MWGRWGGDEVDPRIALFIRSKTYRLLHRSRELITRRFIIPRKIGIRNAVQALDLCPRLM